MKEKPKKKPERDKKGRFVKGHKGGPGRRKGEPRDIICKDGKKRSVDALIDDLLTTYGTLGGEKFLKKWAIQSHSNLRKFVELLFKFAPQPEQFAGDTHIQVISAVPRPSDSVLEKRIRKLEAELEAKEEELQRLRDLANIHDVEKIEHEPIRPAELPEHSMKDPEVMTDEDLDKEIEKIEEELEK